MCFSFLFTGGWQLWNQPSLVYIAICVLYARSTANNISKTAVQQHRLIPNNAIGTKSKVYKFDRVKLDRVKGIPKSSQTHIIFKPKPNCIYAMKLHMPWNYMPWNYMPWNYMPWNYMPWNYMPWNCIFVSSFYWWCSASCSWLVQCNANACLVVIGQGIVY